MIESPSVVKMHTISICPPKRGNKAWQLPQQNFRVWWGVWKMDSTSKVYILCFSEVLKKRREKGEVQYAYLMIWSLILMEWQRVKESIHVGWMLEQSVKWSSIQVSQKKKIWTATSNSDLICMNLYYSCSSKQGHQHFLIIHYDHSLQSRKHSLEITALESRRWQWLVFTFDIGEVRERHVGGKKEGINKLFSERKQQRKGKKWKAVIGDNVISVQKCSSSSTCTSLTSL